MIFHIISSHLQNVPMPKTVNVKIYIYMAAKPIT